MRARSGEHVLDRHHAGARAFAPAGGEVAADMDEQRRVHVLEHTVAHEERLGAEGFLGDARPDDERARQLVAVEDLLHRESRSDDQRMSGVVSFTVPGRASNQLFPRHDSWRLVRRRQAVHVRAERDNRVAGSILGDPRRRHAVHRPLYVEPFADQDIGQPALCLGFLKAQLAETEQGVDELLREGAPRLDLGNDFLLQRLGPGARRRNRLRRRSFVGRSLRGSGRRDERQ